MTETISVRRNLASKWWLFALDGLLVTLMGLLLCFTQLVAAKAFLEIVGLVLIIASIIGAYVSAQASSAGSVSAMRWMTPVIGCALGVFLFADPEHSIRMLAWIFGLGTLLVGALQLSAGLGMAGHQARGLMITLGILALIAGFVMMSNPLLTARILTIFFGIQFVLTGVLRIGASMQLRSLDA